MKNSKIIIKPFIALLIMIVGFTSVFNTKTYALVPMYQLMQSSTVVWVDNGVETPLPQTSALPNNAVLKVDLHIQNVSGIIDAKVGISNKEGFDFGEYYEGIFQFGGTNATKDEYTALMNGNYDMILSSAFQNIVVYVVAKETLKNKVAFDVDVYSNDVDPGPKRSIVEHSFATKFNASKSYMVSFYGEENQLISRERVVAGDTPRIAALEQQGKILVGYNTKKNRSGAMYSGEPVHSTLHLYAMFDKQMFKVNYYVGTELYQTELVEYGKNAPNVKGPKRKKNTFQYWDGNLNQVMGDIDVYAVYEQKSPTLAFRKLGSFEGDGSTILVKDYHVKTKNKTTEPLKYEDEYITTTVIKNEKKQKSILIIVLCILVVLAVVANYIYQKRRSKKRGV